MKNLESSSDLKSSLICRFDNHSIIQKARERETERANEALETRHDTTLKCGSSITIAVPKVALIPVRHSRKRPKRMQDGMRKLCLEGRSSLVLSVLALHTDRLRPQLVRPPMIMINGPPLAEHISQCAEK